jgi:hypothetical protein
MNDCYGVDPETPANPAELGVMAMRFRPSEGRFILEYPNDWESRALDHARRISDLAASKATERLRQLRGSLLPSRERYDPNRPWAENALRISPQVRALIGPSNSPPTVVKFAKTIEEPELLPEAGEARIQKTVNAYVTAARPLLLTSPKIVLIDPFFSLLMSGGTPDRRQGVLRAFLETARQGRARIFRLVVGAKAFGTEDPQGKAYRRTFEAIAERAGAGGLTLEVGTVGEHPRYLLGMHSGLQFDWGFDIPKDGRLNHVHWLKDSVLQPLLKEYT